MRKMIRHTQDKEKHEVQKKEHQSEFRYYNTKTFGDLYSYIGNYIEFGIKKKQCDSTHKRTKEFCELNGINFERLYKIHLKTTGGCCCDCEILLNTVNQREHNEVIIQ